ncbi:MAG: flagellar basal body rod protein FlgC [Erythrobacter sp.]|jgi:flagellar basal-body rod protein FlgC|nr:flagellar basal body rod protein FlgC [Erythrobacter sp.]PKP65829.1 MAG: flagellar basal body rod protein FlgC [Alphaproteobacteria bacterium HGW-Alphaproteobacteria-7]MDP2130039.1 flagellar basal body rod protein FlgC [Erythrobacter sp.]MDZ4137448.1 flagellar basal body rod protein FlgC [Erythrobacter sp.]MDZ4273852.1 flagellar basal body rod protein FlgC [Erythrobacter sp.]
MPEQPPMTLFSMTTRAMQAQMVRMNAATSNLANAGSVSSTEAGAYRPIRAVFAVELDRASGLAGVTTTGLVRAETAATKRYDPGHPLADADGNVFEAPVDETAEMVEIMESARQYQNLVQALQTAKQLMLETLRSQ